VTDAADASVGDARADGAAGAGGSSGADAGRDAAGDARADAPMTLAECEIISCGGVASNHSCCGDIFSFALNAAETLTIRTESSGAGNVRLVVTDIDVAEQHGATASHALSRVLKMRRQRAQRVWVRPARRG
jgi:hypothetical protein